MDENRLEEICKWVEPYSGSTFTDTIRELVTEVERLKTEHKLWEEELSKVAYCEDCGKFYSDFCLDTTLPDDQWLAIHPSGEGGLLCANCMVARGSRLHGATVAKMFFGMAPSSEQESEDE